MSRKQSSLSDKASAALKQAAKKVIQRAKQTGTPVILWEDGHIKEVPTDQLENEKSMKPRKRSTS